MRTNESAETKGKCRHGKGISLKMSKDRGIWHSVRERMIKHNRKDHMVKRAWYLPDKYPETRKNRSNSDWSALLIIIWHDDGGIWRNDDMTNQSQWSLSYPGIRRDVMSVLSSNHFSFQQLNNHPMNHLLLHPTCPCLTAALSNLPAGWTPSLGRFPNNVEGTIRLDNR